MRDVSRHMIVIRATADEVDLSGSPSALRQLARSIGELKTGQEYRCSADAAADPEPYERCLTGLRVAATDGPVRVSVDGALLVVEGDKSNLDRFTSFLAIEGPGTHSHYEYHEGNLYIAQDSQSLVVSCDG